uniref:Uncharacterized protein n=1 Tax=Cannabis sativa TaxID=3483 RepID=A0A803P744_CANSA
MGDVNNVCNVKDKRGGRPYPASLIQGFNDALSVGRLQDLCLEGYPFTWERGRGPDKSLIGVKGQNNCWLKEEGDQNTRSISTHLLVPGSETILLQAFVIMMEKEWTGHGFYGEMHQKPWSMFSWTVRLPKIAGLFSMKVRNELVWNKATPAAFNVVIAAVNLFDLWNSAHTDNHSDTLNADGANRCGEWQRRLA